MKRKRTSKSSYEERLRERKPSREERLGKRKPSCEERSRESESSYEEWLLWQLFVAYQEARKGKRTTADEFKFEMNWAENLMRLNEDILQYRYKPSRGIAFITKRPVIREIFAAPFRDRVIHHFLFNMSAEWWDRRLIYDSYSCRKTKGTLFGINRLEYHIKAVSRNYTRKAYVIKLDIQGYFMSLDREKLYERVVWGLKRQFPEWNSEEGDSMYDLLRYLWKEIIFDDPIRGVKRRGRISDWKLLPKSKSLFGQPPGKGIVIGNLSSQLLSNIYLDQLDRFVTKTLGYKHYGRYVDDFFIIVTEEEYPQALKDIKRIEAYLRDELKLTLHPKKRYVQEISKGVEFLGVVLYPWFRVPSKRFKQHFYSAAFEVEWGLKGPETITSYLGHLKHMNGKKIAARTFEKVGWEYRG